MTSGPPLRGIGEHIARRRVDCEQYAGIAGAQQPTRGRIEVQSMRSRRRDLVLLQDLVGSRASIAMIHAGAATLTKNVSRAAS